MATLRGTVTGPDGAPLGGVHVALVGRSPTTVTDAVGRYELRGIAWGPGQVSFAFLGYRTELLDLVFQGDTLLQLNVALELEAIPLDPLTVRVPSSTPPQLQGFYDRRERGTGFYFTPTEIERMQARQVTEVLRRVPGIAFQSVPGPFGTVYQLQMTRTTGAAGARACPPLYFVNGMPFPVAADVGLDAFVRPDEIAGIEVYHGPSGVPPQFASGPTSSRCGVIVIWTHAGRIRRD